MPKGSPRSKRFKIGDRVVNKPGMSVVGKFTQARPNLKTKHGTVTGIIYKTNKSGVDHPYVEVLWDKSTRPDLHAANRLYFESEKDWMLQNERENW